MCCDRISELPDSLLTHILSYLPTKDSDKTSVLSKRWELLWLKVTGLDLNTMDFLPYDGEPLLSFMDRFLEFNRGSCLQTFKLKYCRYTEIEDDSSIRLLEWIPELIRRGVQHLDLENKIVPRVVDDIIPDCIYVSKTLVTLKLVYVGLEDLKFAVSLPCLKTLHLENNYILHHTPSCDFFCDIDFVNGNGQLIMENLISGSPVLENVTMFFSVWEGEFSSSWTNVPQCLSSTLESVEISVRTIMTEAGIKLANYFLENSAVLKKLTLSCKNCLTDKREAESYKKLLTSTKLSPRCKVLVC